MSARNRARDKRAKRNRKKDKPTGPEQKADLASPTPTNGEQLKRLQQWLLPDGIFSGLSVHGNTKWTPAALAWLALCWAWSGSKNVTDAFAEAVKQCRVLGVAPVGTYQGFMNALATWTDRLMRLLWPILHQRMQDIGGRFWRIGGWVPIAFDGSRSSAPRTRSNEKAFCAENYGKGHTAKYRKKKSKGLRRKKNQKSKPQPPKPQAWITLMWHMGLRLPWMWRLGPSNSSERAHVMDMLEAGDFPETTLFCGDAGFVGYPLWTRILSRGGQFLVRVGANVNLLTKSADYSLQKNGRVLCWPKSAIRSRQAPLPLRLVKVRVGKTEMWMLTSVLDASELTKKQIVQFYEMRWGVEVEFRGLKQTLDRRKLRCRNSRRLLAELNWSIMAMAVAELFALKEQLAAAQDASAADRPAWDPKKRSLANTIRALRTCLSELKEVPKAGQDLLTKLRLAVTDSYVRSSSKDARYCPPNPDKKPLGDPKIRTLTEEEKEALKALSAEKKAA